MTARKQSSDCGKGVYQVLLTTCVKLFDRCRKETKRHGSGRYEPLFPRLARPLSIQSNLYGVPDSEWMISSKQSMRKEMGTVL